MIIQSIMLSPTLLLGAATFFLSLQSNIAHAQVAEDCIAITSASDKQFLVSNQCAFPVFFFACTGEPCDGHFTRMARRTIPAKSNLELSGSTSVVKEHFGSCQGGANLSAYISFKQSFANYNCGTADSPAPTIASATPPSANTLDAAPREAAAKTSSDIRFLDCPNGGRIEVRALGDFPGIYSIRASDGSHGALNLTKELSSISELASRLPRRAAGEKQTENNATGAIIEGNFNPQQREIAALERKIELASEAYSQRIVEFAHSSCPNPDKSDVSVIKTIEQWVKEQAWGDCDPLLSRKDPKSCSYCKFCIPKLTPCVCVRG